jgi:hypothetical protein
MAKTKKKPLKSTGKSNKSAPKKPAGKVAAKPAPRKTPRSASWLDAGAHAPVIEQYARRLKSFMAAMADGRIDDAELEAQEARLVTLMKEIEPQLPEPLHTRVTQLLCELTAYDIMQMLHSLQAQRPQSVFRG